MSTLPTKTQIEEQKDKIYGRFIIEPLEQGFGQTLGNSLRRVLLSQLEGAAITRIKIDQVAHEFSTIPGVKEDVVELLLNLKKVQFEMTKKPSIFITINVIGPGEVKAGQIECPTGIEVVNKELVIAHLADKKSKLNLEATVEYSKGYRLAESDTPVGVIALDSNFSPVVRVNYRVEDTRLGRTTNLDKLILEIWTNGALTPQIALDQAVAILIEQFKNLSSKYQIPDPDVKDNNLNKSAVVNQADNQSDSGETVYIEELNLPTKVVNLLKKEAVETVSDLSGKTAEDLGKIKHIGPKTIETILKKVNKIKAKK